MTRYLRLFLLFYALPFLGQSLLPQHLFAQHPGAVMLSAAKFKTSEAAEDLSSPSLNDHSWKEMVAGKVWQEQGYPDYHGYAWYRFHVRLQKTGHWKDSLRIFLAHVNDCDVTYLNGIQIGKTGNMPEDPGGYVTKWPNVRSYHLPVNHPAIKWGQENVIAVKVYDGGGTGGIFMGQPFVDMLEKVDGLSVSLGKIKNNFGVRVDGTFSYEIADEGKEIQKISGVYKLAPFEEKVFSFNVPQKDGIVFKYTFQEKVTGLKTSGQIIVPYIQTPAGSVFPKINNAPVLGARPGHPILFRIAATGEAPLSYKVTGLPVGLVQEGNIIKGSIAAKGRYYLDIQVSNAHGTTNKNLLIKVDSLLQLTPPMGWNSWNCWGVSVSEEKVKSSAQALIDKGLADHGWSYINIDDGWQAAARNADGSLSPNEKFSDMKSLGAWLHGHGLKYGIYSSPGPLTCGGFLGSYQHEVADANAYGAWGVDYLKYDWCSYVQTDTSLAAYVYPFKVMQDALAAQSRDIVYNLCQYGMKRVWEWGHTVGAQSWRTTEDIDDTWESLYNIGFSQGPLASFAGPGKWNDPDMMIVGQVGWGESLHPSRLTPDEQYTHVSLWSLLSAPLLIGCDISKLDSFTLNLLTNDEVIAIDQDTLGKQAQRVSDNIWVKELADGSRAIGLFNLDTVYREVAVALKESSLVRNVWRQQDEGIFKDTYRARIPPHGVRLIKVTPALSAEITIKNNVPGSAVPATLHGIFFEEISHAGEGGLYAEMIQNRGFEESRIPAGTRLVNGMLEAPPTEWKMEWPYKSEWPAWTVSVSGEEESTAASFSGSAHSSGMQRASQPATLKDGRNSGIASLSTDHPLSPASPHSLRLQSPAVLSNEGFWGIAVKAGESYQLSFYLRGYKGSVAARLKEGDRILDTRNFLAPGGDWKKYECVFVPGSTASNAKLVLEFKDKGTAYIDFVSLFPTKTFHNRPNGLRNDIATLIDSLHPSFVRWPGGCFVEGITIESAPNWKNTIGKLEDRPGTFSPWGYWSSDGFGYHEYLQFCEDIHADALFVFNAGTSCEYRSGTSVPDSLLAPYIQDALDAIAYATDPVSSKWGALRAENGHPAPFPLKYVEVGNEQHGPVYARRYNLFYDAIHAKYPAIIILASMGISDVNRHTLDSMKHVQRVDEHAYKDAYWSMRNFDHFDKYKRGDWDMYVGEYATNSGVGTGNMQAAVSDAIYVLSMEKNADLVKMSSYAPLLVNEHDVDWPVNLIHFDAARNYARISYYAIKLLADNKADYNIPSTLRISADHDQALFPGGIGLGTWDTEAEFKDIKVNGQAYPLSEWAFPRGAWKVSDGVIAQTAEGAQQLAVLKGHTFDTYTLELKARKTGGVNAFMIPFAVLDSNTYLRAHIGSYWNSHCVFESVTNGYEVAGITDQKNLHPLETGRWYDVKLAVGKDTVKCYLNDTLIMTYIPPQQFYSIAGKAANGDIIVKAVNGYPTSVLTDLKLETGGRHMLSISTISADGGAENSMETPVQYVASTVMGDSMKVLLKANSINVIRIKAH
ncbi:alpha-L-arabinofuranosidase C-terminal domain-containing protein [Chitinophaga sancti]|uniref:Alpha-galactosidase n=1 Tax=Chitinophaga sancti TaxID=1004 RepID=A0A1K1RQ67_9BACT|nr:alpha-L-arabinofuranosidase C-terminal domain-containing protein [Chitinophaga sancti]WQD62541.1 alpha-L-arabinofuranosidase C-terminal domain-containing protein [Chitinophaga sancti]WQG91890.1 alpha-L-arabinofuranosidase C-terminal domain-containing protein [Chitinophaga sancti]SFW74042.1 Alpha-L-arabinofuranosidase [Chitinophaga sancti]